MTRPSEVDASSWELLCRAPLTIWLALTLVDSTVDSPAREAAAFEAALERARGRCADDALLRAVLQQARPPSCAQRHGTAAADVEELLRRLEQVRAVIDEHCAADAAERFKRVLIDMGQCIARAANESVLGSRLAISQSEERFLYRARRALGLLPPQTR
jgi:hypothetical protein